MPFLGCLFVCSFMFVCLGGFFVINTFIWIQSPYVNSYLTQLLGLNIYSSTDTIIEACIGLNALPSSHRRWLHPFWKLTLVLVLFNLTSYESKLWQSKFLNLNACWQKFGYLPIARNFTDVLTFGLIQSDFLMKKINTKYCFAWTVKR